MGAKPAFIFASIFSLYIVFLESVLFFLPLLFGVKSIKGSIMEMKTWLKLALC